MKSRLAPPERPLTDGVIVLRLPSIADVADIAAHAHTPGGLEGAGFHSRPMLQPSGTYGSWTIGCGGGLTLTATTDPPSQRPWIDGPPGSAMRQSVDRLRTSGQLALRGAHSCLEFPAVLALVAGGHGAALVPDLALAPRHPSRTRIVDLPDLGARRINAIYRQSKTPTPPAVAALLDALTDAAHPTALT